MASDEHAAVEAERQRLLERRIPRTHLLGSGPVYVAAFLDFACGRCAHRWENVEELLRLRRSIARVGLVPTPHEARGKADFPGGTQAALAAEAAVLQGRFVEVSRLLFQNQADIGRQRDVIDHVAHEGHLDAARLRQDAASVDVRRALDERVALADDAGVRETPTFFVEGRMLVDPQLGQLLEAVDQAAPPSHATRSS